MSRPEKYLRIDRIPKPDRDRLILGSPVMYAITHKDQFVTLAYDKNIESKFPVIKYKKLWFSTKKQAENQCLRLNKMSPDKQFEVVEITL